MPPTDRLDAIVVTIVKALDRQNTALERLGAVTYLMHRLQTIQRGEVERARREGATWEEIGAVMGLTRQAVHQRFAKNPNM